MLKKEESCLNIPSQRECLSKSGKASTVSAIWSLIFLRGEFAFPIFAVTVLFVPVQDASPAYPSWRAIGQEDPKWRPPTSQCHRPQRTANLPRYFLLSWESRLQNRLFHFWKIRELNTKCWEQICLALFIPAQISSLPHPLARQYTSHEIHR